MLKQLQLFFRNKFLFLFLLPLFYVWHGYVENYNLVSLKGMILLLAIFTGISLFCYLSLFIIYRNRARAATGALLLMLVFLFFGPFRDFLLRIAPGLFINRYSFLLPFILVTVIILLRLLKSMKSAPGKLVVYVNTLFVLFLLVDTGRMLVKAGQYKKQVLLSSVPGFRDCDSCSRPDVFLILADEYAGHESLDSFFRFNNAAFEEQLRARGFHIVPGSHSNYNSTPFSMASLLNMSYLNGLKGSHKSRKDLNTCYHALENSKLVSFFKDRGYLFYNYSPFDIAGTPSRTEENFLPQNTSWISGQTLYGRIRRDLGYHWLRFFGGKKAMRRYNEKEGKNNQRNEALTIDLLKSVPEKPRFVYTHLMLPHYPYYFNKDGQPYAIETVQDHYNDKDRYIQYLQYANLRLLALVDSILAASPSPVILLMGDHGFRQWDNPPSMHALYNNLNAVLIPGRDYSRFYEGISNVNEFRVLLNTVFGQQLALLKDSTVFISDKLTD